MDSHYQRRLQSCGRHSCCRVASNNLQVGPAKRSTKDFIMAGWIPSRPTDSLMSICPGCMRTGSSVICRSSMSGGWSGGSNSMCTFSSTLCTLLKQSQFFPLLSSPTTTELVSQPPPYGVLPAVPKRNISWANPERTWLQLVVASDDFHQSFGLTYMLSLSSPCPTALLGFIQESKSAQTLCAPTHHRPTSNCTASFNSSIHRYKPILQDGQRLSCYPPQVSQIGFLSVMPALIYGYEASLYPFLQSFLLS